MLASARSTTRSSALYPLIIIGGGPAGYTAAIYAARAGLHPILYQGPEPGGQLMGTSEVENYPGYPKGVLGPDMMEDFKQQAIRFGTKIRTGIITEVNFNQRPFIITINKEQKIFAKSLIIATGSSAKWLGLSEEKKLNGKGVSACAICDGFFFKGEPVAVVGGGDSAAQEAIYLSHLCEKVYLIVRRDKMRASLIMQQRVQRRTNITILWNSETCKILGEEIVTGVEIIHKPTQKKKQIPIKGFFVAIGHRPNTAPFINQLETDASGYIITKEKSTATNIKGIFAAGDVQDKDYRQAVTAAGSGCMAALEVERFLSSEQDNFTNN